MSVPPRVPPVPAVLRLVQLAVLGRWREAGEELYRAVADVTGAEQGQELLVAGCGDGVGAEWLATRTQASVTAVDADRGRIERAERRLRASSRRPPLSFQHAALDDLPHETAVFDVAVGETALAAATDPSRAVAELVRVTKPMGVVVLLQLTWGSELSADEQERVVERLGLRPHLLIEWKRMLRDAGVVDCHVQDWTPGGSVATIGLSWSEKVQIAGQAMRTSGGGWRTMRQAVDREIHLLRELADERAIGFQLIKGVKWPHARPV
ncbi:MAG TPA: class I SAM-dependent methyltransferase [Gemmatimonadaceae bacterium]|jgi:ubiquinone/menaquinone biosynthesis C-methylase UbiE|nr:class I SAM-dependent methyltransferase [Gemmatimonadaceae bacterium]